MNNTIDINTIILRGDFNVLSGNLAIGTRRITNARITTSPVTPVGKNAIIIARIKQISLILGSNLWINES
jgi:hypothetical protein